MFLYSGVYHSVNANLQLTVNEVIKGRNVKSNKKAFETVVTTSKDSIT